MKEIHYAWIILIITFLSLLFVQGIRLSFGAFIEPWESTFNTTRSVVTSISLVSYLVFAIFQPLMGKLIDKYGVKNIFLISLLIVALSVILTAFATELWQIMILYGLIGSVGFGGVSNVVGSVAITKWFSKKRGFALGIMSAGTAAGQLVLVPISLFLIQLIGWKYTLLVLGANILIIIAPVVYLFFISSPIERGIKSFGSNNSLVVEETTKNSAQSLENQRPLASYMMSRPFLFLMFPFFVCGFTTSGLIDTHLIPFTQYCGLSATTAGVAVSILAFFNLSFTIISGFFSDRWDCRKMLGFMYLIRALTIVLLIIIVNDVGLLVFFLSQSHLLIIFAISFGIVDFATVAPTIKLISVYFSHLSVGFIIGIIFFSHQVGAAFGSFIPGLLFDLTNGYESSFICSIILLIIASFMSFLLPKTADNQRNAGRTKKGTLSLME